MNYQGVIKKSRTLDVLAIYAIIESVLMAAQDELSNLGITGQAQSIVRLVMIGFLAYLRIKTTGPVGEK